jgi:hypothetical protein
MSLLGAEPAPNAFRYSGIPGHVESYFWRANDPTAPRAIWLKATVLAPLDGPAVAESWLIWFDGVLGKTFATKQTWPISGAQFPAADGGGELHLGDWRLAPGANGSAEGSVTSPQGKARFKVGWRRDASVQGEPLAIYPWRLLREGPFPKSKLLTPYPWLRFDGDVTVGDDTVSLSGWNGMQGHNWGKSHAFEYAWGQCLFPAQGAEPEAMVEGFSGRILVAGRPTPRFSALVVRRGSREYRFDGIFDTWRQEAHLEADRWTVRLRSGVGEVRLRMDATERPIACLGYMNPNGRLSYCFNSKLAATLLEVHPRGEAAFTCRSGHGGALEFLRGQPDPRFTVV